VSEKLCIDAVIAHDGRRGHASRRRMSLAQFHRQLELLLHELNSFYELTANGREIESPAAKRREVEQMFGVLSRQVLGTLPSRLPRPTSTTP
jgi:hypothetical protein